MGVAVSPVEGRADLARFIELPYQLYQRDPYWVPPLRIQQRELFNEQKHPFYKHSRAQHFLARDGDRIVGRISAIIGRQATEIGYFGFFECTDSEAASGQLFHSALEWLAKNGARRVLGPMNPSTNYECGLLVEGFDSSPQVMMTYNPSYYVRLIEKAGLRKAKDLWAYGGDLRKVNIAKARRVAERSQANRKLTIRQIRMKQFDSEVEIMWKLYNAAWSRNWGYEQISLEEFKFQARDLKSVVDPGLVLVGEVDGAPVGFALALPDINMALKQAGGRLFPLGLLKILYYQRKIRTMRVVALGVVEEHRTAGAAAAFYSTLLDYAVGKGYGPCEFSWVLEDNILMNRSIEAFGVQRYKNYRIYEWTQDYA